MLDQAADLEQLAREVADLRADVRAAQVALLEAQITPGSFARMASSDAPAGSTGAGAYAPATILGSGVVTEDSIAPGAVSSTAFASGIVPPRVVSALPTLPDAAYPAGAIVFLTTDVPPALYKTTTGLVGSWTKLVDAADIVSNSITAGQIAAGAIGTDEIAAGAVTTAKLDLEDAYGSTILTSQGFGWAWMRFIQTGLYNSDLYLAPPTPASWLSDPDNLIPYWGLDTQGSSIDAKSVTSTATASGRCLEVVIAPGSLNDFCYITQEVGIDSDRAQTKKMLVRCTVKNIATPSSQIYIALFGYWYKADGVTQTGGLAGSGRASTNWSGDEVFDMAEDLGSPPADAAYLRLSVGAWRGTAGLDSGTLEFSDIRFELGEGSDISTYGIGSARVVALTHGSAGYFDIWGDGASYPYAVFDQPKKGLYLGGGTATADAVLYRHDAYQLRTDGDLLATGGILVTKVRTDAGFSDSDFAGSTAYNGGIGVNSNTGRIYFRYGGAWHYCAQDGGFSIPAYEASCPACGEPLLPDDALVGKGDRFESDGALHGLWVHLRCADRSLDRAVADALWEQSGRGQESPPAQAVRPVAD
jgi:hypothetical protein